jgi:hypothetical protein
MKVWEFDHCVINLEQCFTFEKIKDEIEHKFGIKFYSVNKSCVVVEWEKEDERDMFFNNILEFLKEKD